MSVFACLLTAYSTRHSSISSSLTCRRSYAYLLPTAPDTAVLAAASHVNVMQAYLLSTPPNIAVLAAVSHVNVRMSPYFLHHQTQQD
jgi:hypothetical protein